MPRGSQDAPKLSILAPKCDQDGQLGGPNEAFEKLQGHFSGSWTRSYEKIDKLKKRTTVQRFGRILACWRVWSDPLGAIVCSSRCYLGLCWAILASFFDNIATRCDNLGSKMRSKTAKMCRHGRQGDRWRGFRAVAGDPKRSHLPSPHPSPTLQPRAYEIHQDAAKVLALSGIYIYIYIYIYLYSKRQPERPDVLLCFLAD